MNLSDVRREVEIDATGIQRTLADLAEVFREAGEKPLSATQRTAAAAYMAQCYTGVENILKRVARYCGIGLPAKADWHIELLKLFREGEPNVPCLLDETLFSELSELRRFRHLVLHRYSFTIDSETVASRGRDAPRILKGFLDRVELYLNGQASGSDGMQDESC